MLRHLRYRAAGIALLIAGIRAISAQTVNIQVDAAKDLGPLRPVWSFFGYDEPNFTYMKDGKKLLSELSALSPATVYVRTHNLLTSGDGTPSLKWGSTNAYTEDAAGKPHYDWTIVDRIFDTLHERGMKPIVQLGFMPQALSVKPTPYQHTWSQDKPYADIYTGWAHPPKDYDKWRELAYQLAKHTVERYGRSEVESWYWEVWNEPDIGYWQGTPQEFNKLYDYAVDGVKRALSTAKIGGPDSTGPGSEKAAKFLQQFLKHVTSEENYATGRIGSPIDIITFHAKGRPTIVDNHVRMGSDVQLRSIDKGFEIIASFPELKNLPVILGESDPEGCAACSVRYNPQNGYRNGTMYPSYTAATFARKYDIAARHKVNFEGAVTWAFEFEGQPYFDGYRDLATNGIDKPVLNVFRMFGMMGPQRVEARSSGQIELDTFLKGGAKANADIGALASRDERSLTIMLWNYHDDDLPAPPADLELNISGLPSKRIMTQHYQVDGDHGNSYEAWKKMGSPQKPSEEQYAQLERAGQLDTVGSPDWRTPADGKIPLKLKLPRQGVALVKLVW